MMPQRHPLLLTTLCLLLASCASKEQPLPDDPLAFPPEEQETAYIPTYSKEVVSGWPKGRELDPHDRSRVRLGEEVHAYHVGRLPSHDRREMHEAHTVYKVEQDARWDTRLPATPMRSRGVVLGVVDPSRNAIPQDVVIEQERQALMNKTRSLEATMARLSALQKDLEKKRAEFDAAESEFQRIKEHLATTIQERDAKAAELEQVKARALELEENDRLRVKSSTTLFPGKK